MKEGFDISKIKIKSTKEPNIERKLTDEVITSLDPNTDVKPNAEIEKDEYVRFPDGTIQLAAGNKHEQGGIKVYLPDGTQVLTNNLKLTKDHVSEIKDEYGLNLSTKDTYAVAMKKFDAANGITKLNDEQEELFKELKKLQDRQKDGKLSDGDHRVNHGYLSEKINNIEKEKESKLAERNDFFTRIFEKQETLEKPSVAERKSQNMKYGGVSEADFKHLCRKHGISEDVGRDLLKGVLPSFDNGGEVEEIKKKMDQIDPEGKYRTLEALSAAYDAGEISSDDYDLMDTYLNNLKIAEKKPEYTKHEITTEGSKAWSGRSGVDERVHQSRGTTAYGKVTESNISDAMYNAMVNFPDIAEEVLGVKRKDGEITWDKSIKLSGTNPKVKEFQEKVNARMTASANTVINNPDLYSEDAVKEAQRFLDEETFVKDPTTVRDFDAKFGNFTSTRYNLGTNVITPEEKKALEDKGITTLTQLQAALKDDPELISAMSKEKVDKISGVLEENADFTLNTYTPEKVPDKTPDKTPNKPLVDDLDFSIRRRGLPYLGLYPEQRPLPPSPMEAHLMGNIRLGRIDPIRIGIEDKIQASHDRLNFTADQIAHLPPEQRAIVLANAQAIEAKGLNDAIIKTNVINAQNQASAELFNIGQSDREEFANLQNRLSFEERQLTDKAKTQEEFRNYFKELKRQRAERFRWDQNVALLQEMTPDVSLNAWGTGVDVHPTGPIINDWKGLFDVGVNPYPGETT